jgi:ABC-type iron transport system FetAB permease component
MAVMPLELPGAIEGPIFSGLKPVKAKRASTR